MQKNYANDARDTGRPVVSHIDNLSIWLFSVGDVDMSQEIWSKYVQEFNCYIQTTQTDNRGDSSRPVVSQLKNKSKYSISVGHASHEVRSKLVQWCSRYSQKHKQCS
jgi:hypothetical protein